MVSQGSHIIIDCIHQFDDGRALVHAAVSGPLKVVSGIHQQRPRRFLLQRRDFGIGPPIRSVINVAVDVIGVIHHNFPLCRCRRDPTGKADRQSEDNTE